MTRDMRPVTVDSIRADRVGLRLALAWRGDRLTHTISLIDPGRVAPWLVSVEGSDTMAWPPSPPLQQQERQQADAGHQWVMAVGMAGRSHWSVSFEAIPEEAALVVDVACRYQVVPQWLGSTYQACYGGPLTMGAQGFITGEGDRFGCRCTAEFAGQYPLPALEIVAGQLRISASDPLHQPGPLPRTARWKYRFQRS